MVRSKVSGFQIAFMSRLADLHDQTIEQAGEVSVAKSCS